MRSFAPSKQQTLSLNQKYSLYLVKGPKSDSKLSNKYNMFDDLNVKDKVIMEETRNYLRSAHGTNKTGAKSAQSIKEKAMPKDRGRKAIKKPKQLKVKA